mgnify:CR=1 FL=1
MNGAQMMSRTVLLLFALALAACEDTAPPGEKCNDVREMRFYPLGAFQSSGWNYQRIHTVCVVEERKLPRPLQ